MQYDSTSNLYQLQEILSIFFIINLDYNYNVLMSINLERSLDISNLCQDILSVHPQTRYSSFINRNCRIVESKFVMMVILQVLANKRWKYSTCSINYNYQWTKNSMKNWALSQLYYDPKRIYSTFSFPI